MATKSLTLNLTVDTSSNRVLFAEADRDFVEVLLSFLTLPLSTLVSITKGNSLPSLANLYRSVESLGDEYFQSIPCRGMLLKPNHASEFECLDLFVNVEGDRALIYYICSQKDCPYELISSYARARCKCGNKMSRRVQVVRSSDKKESNQGVFLKGATRFVITDNVTVSPLCTQAAILCYAGKNSKNVMERQVNVGLSEIIAILHQSLISEAALTNVFLVREIDISLEKKNSAFALISRTKSNPDPAQDTIGIKLIVDKHENKVIYAECKQDFIDILFSFLTYPSGFVIKRLKGKSHVTCLDNLYGSVLSQPMSDCFKACESKEHLVNPKLLSHFRLSKSLLKSIEVKPRYYMCRSPDCDSNKVSLIPNAQCKCKCITNKLMKIPEATGFVSETTYVVTDDLVVNPLLSISTLWRMIETAREGVQEIPVNIRVTEVLALLEATLGSRSVLTNAFLVKKQTASSAVPAIDAEHTSMSDRNIPTYDTCIIN